MKLTRVVERCDNGPCPTLYTTDRGTYVLQGFRVTDPEALTALNLPAHETAVEVPRALLTDAVAKGA